MSKKTTGKKIIAKNKKALFDYQIIDKIEAGIVLKGAEVKSVKQSKVNLKGSYISIDNEEIFAKDIQISAYQAKNQVDYAPKRKRKLLLKKKEILNLSKQLNTKGIAIIPLQVYLIQGLIKVEIGIGKGKTKYDKRHDLKEKNQNLEIKRALKKYS